MPGASQYPFNHNVRNSGGDVLRDHLLMREGDAIAKKHSEEAKKSLPMKVITGGLPFPSLVLNVVRIEETVFPIQRGSTPGLSGGQIQ